MNIILRNATLQDLPIIQHVNNLLFEYETENGFDNYISNWALGEESAEYFSELIQNQFVIIAETEKEPVGYLAGSIYQDNTYSYYEGKTAELENMLVVEKYRKFGIGSKLVNAFLKWCKDNSARRVLVTATIGNETAISFYKKNGFKELNITLKKELK